MGLDIEEFIIDVEQEFGITITDEEAQSWVTMGHVVAGVKAKLREQDRHFSTGEAFWALRKALLEGAGVPRKWLRPSTPAKSVLPWWGRQRTWKAVSDRLRKDGYSLPGLQATRGCTVLPLVALVAALGYWAGIVPPHWPHAAWIRFAVAFVAFLAACVGIGRVFMTRFPKGAETVGDLARAISPCLTAEQLAAVEASAEQDLEAAPAPFCESGEAFRAIRRAFVEEAGVARKGFRPSTPLRKVVPWFARRKAWRKVGVWLAKRHYGGFPGLRLSQAGSALLTFLGIVCFGWFVGVVDWPRHPDMRCFLAVVAFLAAMTCILVFLRRRLPEGCKTVGELAQHIALPLSGAIEIRLLALASERFGVPVKDISWKTKLVDL